MGVIYALGLGEPVDKAQSEQWLEKASAQFNTGRSPARTDSFAWLGYAYSGGIFGSNPPKSREWYQRDLALTARGESQ
jgi:TPR repeat protein